MSRIVSGLSLAILSTWFLACGDDSPTATTGTGAGESSGGGGASAASTTTSVSSASSSSQGGAEPLHPGPGEACNASNQDCANPDAPKCTLDFGDPKELPSTCEQTYGRAMAGELCERPTNEPGIDTCAPGLFCSNIGHPLSNPHERDCKPLCDEHADCATAPNACGSTTPPWGFCPTRGSSAIACRLFASSSTRPPVRLRARSASRRPRSIR